jgi:hypothetical protein
VRLEALLKASLLVCYWLLMISDSVLSPALGLLYTGH